MTKAKILRKIGLYSTTAILTFGVIVAFGILSASGMLVVSPSVGLAIAAFIFGGVVEGEVFKQEIMEGIEDLKLLGNKGYQYLVTQALEKHILQLKQHGALSGFLLEYDELCEYLASLENKKLSVAQTAEKKRARQRLKQMQILLTQYVLEEDSQHEYMGGVVDVLRAYRRSFSIKMITYRITLLFSILCGMGFGFAVASALPAALLAVSASLSFLVWPLAVIAAIGYTFLIFHTVKDLLLSDTFTRWKENIKEWFKLEDGRVTVKYILKVIALGLVTAALLALCVVATLATAGTWWLAVKNGAKLIPGLQRIAGIIRNVLTPLLVVGDFIFSLFNSLASLNLVVTTLHQARPLQYIKQAWTSLRQDENLLQIFNPFRIIYKCIQKTIDLALLIGHTLASGVARDKFLTVPPVVLAGAGAGREFCADVPFFFEEDKETITQKIILWLMSPLVAVSALWQYTASQWNSAKPVLTLSQCFKDAFNLHDDPLAPDSLAPQTSSAWRTFSIERAFAIELKRLQAATSNPQLAQEKCRALEGVKDCLLNNQSPSQRDLSVLQAPRLFATQPRSHIFATTMIKRYYEH